MGEQEQNILRDPNRIETDIQTLQGQVWQLTARLRKTDDKKERQQIEQQIADKKAEIARLQRTPKAQKERKAQTRMTRETVEEE